MTEDISHLFNERRYIYNIQKTGHVGRSTPGCTIACLLWVCTGIADVVEMNMIHTLVTRKCLSTGRSCQWKKRHSKERVSGKSWYLNTRLFVRNIWWNVIGKEVTHSYKLIFLRIYLALCWRSKEVVIPPEIDSASILPAKLASYYRIIWLVSASVGWAVGRSARNRFGAAVRW